MSRAPASERFPMRIERSWRVPLLLLFGVRPSDAYVALEGERMHARFGYSRITADLSNIASYELTGPYHAIKAFGVRRSLRGRDGSFCGTARGGVFLRFRRPISWALFRPPAFTVTPEDVDGFVRALEARGIPEYQPPP